MTQFLQAAHAVLLERRIAADEQHRTFRAKSVGHSRHGIGGTRARGDYRTAQTGNARVGIRSVCSHLLMAYGDDLNTFVDTSVVDIDNVATGNGEDVLYALLLQHFGDDLAARNHFRG